MHEMAIAASLVEHVLEVARQQRAVRVDDVELEVGVLQQVVPESLELAFTAAIAGTLAEGARLKLMETPARAVCRPCAREFDAAVDDYRCPQCGQADVRIVGGHDIILKTVVCQTEECVPAP